MNSPKGKRELTQPPRSWAFLAALALLLPGTARCQQSVQVDFALAAPSVTVNEPVYVRLSIHNGLGEEVRFVPAPLRDSYFDLSVTEPNGSTITPEPVVHGGFLHVGAISVAPKASYAKELLVSQRYQFRQPGAYKLKVWLSGSIHTSSGKPVESPSGNLKLTVAPRDPKRLREICQALAKAAAGYSDYGPLREAAVALSFVEDPVAVPYLGQVLADHNLVSGIAVEGLVRIASPEALQVLASNLDTPDPQLRMKIQGGIQEIKTGVHPQVMD